MLVRGLPFKGWFRWHGSLKPVGQVTFPVKFEDNKGGIRTVRGWGGQNVLALAHENGVPIEGACEGSLACSTCHVILASKEDYMKFPEPSEREEDLLDTAPGLTETWVL